MEAQNIPSVEQSAVREDDIEPSHSSLDDNDQQENQINSDAAVRGGDDRDQQLDSSSKS